MQCPWIHLVKYVLHGILDFGGYGMGCYNAEGSHDEHALTGSPTTSDLPLLMLPRSSTKTLSVVALHCLHWLLSASHRHAPRVPIQVQLLGVIKACCLSSASGP